jgi:hypothetical protein
MIFEGRNHRPVSAMIYRVVTVADIFFLQEAIRRFPQTAPNCWYSFRYGDVLPCDSLPSSMLILLVICKITNGSSGVPTGPPLRCLSQFKLIFCRISVISRVQRICFNTWRSSLIYRLTVIKLLKYLEHNPIRSLSPRSHSL